VEARGRFSFGPCPNRLPINVWKCPTSNCRMQSFGGFPGARDGALLVISRVTRAHHTLMHGVTAPTVSLPRLISFSIRQLDYSWLIADLLELWEDSMNIVNLLFMTGKISFIIKSFLTNVTLIRSDFVMNYSNMILEVILNRKGLWTLFTLIKSFWCMLWFMMVFDMQIQIILSSKALITLVTFVWTNIIMYSVHMLC